MWLYIETMMCVEFTQCSVFGQPLDDSLKRLMHFMYLKKVNIAAEAKGKE
jgi:hypothetical protein